MTTKKILIAALLACAFAPALAEEFEMEDQVQRIVTRSTEGIGLQLEHALSLDGNATVLHLGPGKLVKNAPYSAEMVSERTRTLGDGNQIVNKSSSMSYRDSAGRTRTETRGADGEVRSVVIHDPVEGVRYILRPRDKSAMKIVAPNVSAIAAREQARAAAPGTRSTGTSISASPRWAPAPCSANGLARRWRTRSANARPRPATSAPANSMA